MTPWQVAQYPIAFCVTVFIMAFTWSFVSTLIKTTRQNKDDEDDEIDDDDEDYVIHEGKKRKLVDALGDMFFSISTEEAFRKGEDGEYPELYVRATHISKKKNEKSD